MLGKMWEIERLAGLDSADRTPESICACVAKIFQVRETEVALLELSGRLLNFLYPAELRTAGAIPLSSSAVAARTAQTKRAELFNGFTQVKHFSVRNGEVIGVIQVSRKAPRPDAAGPDFTPDDLRKLQWVARFVGRLMAKGRGIAQASSG
jgi:hypothetical protein